MNDDDLRAAREFGRRLAAIETELAHLRTVGRSPQMKQSSLDYSADEDDYGGIEIRVDEQPQAVWGKQPDGTVATVNMPGPPPPPPTGPNVTSLGAAVLVRWDGQFLAGLPRPADFRYVEVHASTVDGFTPGGATKRTTILDTEADGGDAAIDCTEPLFVRLVAVSTSSVRSEPSDQVLAEPGPVVAEDLLDAIVGPEKLTPDLSDTITVASTQAAQAILDAANAQATADGAISTYFQETPPTGLNDTTDLGDLWYQTSTQQAHRWDGAQWVLIQDNAIAEALAAAQNAQDTADGKIRSFFSDTPPDPAVTAIDSGDLWYDSNQGNRVSRWNGAAWTPLPFGTQALVARSITTALLAVGAVKAESIDVGAITAAKLAAVLVLASTFIAGDPTGARTEYGPDGLVQYDGDGQPQVYLGGDGTNYLSIRGFEQTSRHNRCPNPKLTNNSTGWGVFQATGSRVSGSGFGTLYAWRATDSGGSTSRSDISFVNLVVEYGEELVASVDMRASFSGSFRLGWNWKDTNGTILNANPEYGTVVPVAPGSIFRLSAPGRVPDGATKADVVLTVNADMAASSWFEATRLMVESGTQVGSYFDGDGSSTWSTNRLVNPGLESGLYDWYVAGTNTLSLTTTGVRSGANAGLVTDNNTGGNTHYIGTQNPYQVTGGAQVSVSAWIRAAAGSPSTSNWVKIRYYNANGATLPSYDTPTVSGISTTWTLVSGNTVAPEGATTMRLFLTSYPTTTATKWMFDDVSLTVLNPATDASWDGSLGSSTSTMQLTSEQPSTLASLDTSGKLAASDLVVASPDPTFGGTPLSGLLDTSPGHMIRYAPIVSAGTGTGNQSAGSEAQFFELIFEAEPNRAYGIFTTNMVIRGTNVGVRLRYTTDGTTPTNTSPLLTFVNNSADTTCSLSAVGSFPGGNVRLRFSVAVFAGSTGTGSPSANQIVAPSGSAQGIIAYILDLGPLPTASASGGSYQKRDWSPTWSRCFDATGVRNDNMLIVQGDSVNSVSGMNRTMLGFDFTAIQTALSGASIAKVELYMRNTYSRRQSGAWSVISTHNAATPPGSFSGGASPTQYKFAKGEARWQVLDPAIGEALKNGTAKGITFGNSAYTSPDYTSQWGQITDEASPILRITYAK